MSRDDEVGFAEERRRGSSLYGIREVEVECFANGTREFIGHPVLFDDGALGAHDALANNGVRGVARREEHLERGKLRAKQIGEFLSVHLWHDDAGSFVGW